jgi:MFS family permease
MNDEIPPVRAEAAAVPDHDRGPRAPSLFRDKLGWYIGVSAFWFATSMKWFILFLMLPGEVKRIVPDGTQNSSWGLVVAVGAVEAMIGPAIFGYWSDRTRSRWGRRRPFIAVGAGLTALAMLFLGQANSLPLMILAYLFLQISDDVGTGPYAAIVPDVVPAEHRGRASGIMSMLQLAAQIVAVGIGFALRKSPSTIYIVIAVINVVSAIIVLAIVRERGTNLPPATPAETQQKMLRLEDWVAPWKSPDFRWVWFTRFLVAFGFYIITNYVRNYLEDVVPDYTIVPGVKLEDTLLAALIAALSISLSGAFGSVFAGKLADRIGRKKVIVGAGWIMFATLIPFAFIPVYGIVLLLALAFGAAYGAYLSASWALASDILPSRDDAAKDMGIWQASVSTPQVISGAAGALIDFGNKAQMGRGYTLAFLLAAFAFLAGCLLVTKVRGST